MKKIERLGIALIALLAAVIYANSLNSQFVYDDEFLIQKNSLIQNPAFQPELLTKNIRYGCGKETNVYRPLQMLSYKLDYLFWRLNPRGYHLTNISIHILVALAVYFLIKLIFAERLLAFLTALLFAAHPVHTEAVTYISGRADPLSALFFILAFCSYIKQKNSNLRIWHILSLWLYLLALFSRETTLVFLLIILLYDYLFGREKSRRLRDYFAFILLSLGYLFLRIKILGIPTAVKQYVETTLTQRMPGIFCAITDYLRILVFPVNLHMEYIMRLCSFFSVKAVIGIIIVVLSVTFAFRARKKQPLISFAIFWFGINFLPVSNIFALNAFMAEHWLYLPSIGFFLLISCIFRSLFNKGRLIKLITIFFFVLIVSFYSALTMRQNKFWQNPLTLYQRILVFSPGSSRVHNSLGAVYFYQGSYEQAEEEFKKAIEIKPTYADPYNNLGSVYTKVGLLVKAEEAYQKATELDPDSAQFYINLGNSYLLLGQKQKAKEALQAAGGLYRQQGKENQAREIEEFLKALQF